MLTESLNLVVSRVGSLVLYLGVQIGISLMMPAQSSQEHSFKYTRNDPSLLGLCDLPKDFPWRAGHVREQMSLVLIFKNIANERNTEAYALTRKHT